MNNLDEQIKKIDQKLEELEREEREQNEKKAQMGNDLPKREPVDYTQEAIDTIREMVNEMLEIEDLATYREQHLEEHKSRILTLVQWFMYLKREKNTTSEYEEAKKLVMSVGEKHRKLYDWCDELVNKPLPEYEPSIMLDIDFNVSEGTECKVKDDLKVIFDYNQVKEYASYTLLEGNLNNRVLDYKVVYKEKEYPVHHYFKDYMPNWEYDEECPYRVTVINASKDENENYIVNLNVMSWENIEKE